MVSQSYRSVLTGTELYDCSSCFFPLTEFIEIGLTRVFRALGRQEPDCPRESSAPRCSGGHGRTRGDSPRARLGPQLASLQTPSAQSPARDLSKAPGRLGIPHNEQLLVLSRLNRRSGEQRPKWSSRHGDGESERHSAGSSRVPCARTIQSLAPPKWPALIGPMQRPRDHIRVHTIPLKDSIRNRPT